ncbi:MAG: type II toxin-antitoxin system VapC family toxin [Bryobacterales bacterium]|nr:type II toxin-antitoxin system VapC family toxin [Bryobacterales bacterium]
MSLFFDTSALAKLYHQEVGSEIVDVLLSPPQTAFVSRLGITEMHSVLAAKVRTRVLTSPDHDLVCRKFRADARRQRFRVVALRARHFLMAEELLAAHGQTISLRTLDALQLAVALDLAKSGFVKVLVTADRALLKAASLESLACLNPEAPAL